MDDEEKDFFKWFAVIFVMAMLCYTAIEIVKILKG